MGAFCNKPKPINILLVEDNDAHAELIKIALQEHQVQNKVDRLSDGEAALDYLFKRGEYSQVNSPQLILLDLRLPKVDGLEILQEIKKSEELKRTPVIILTTSSEEEDVAKAYDNHVNSYLVKPLDFEQFSNLMERFGFYWSSVNFYPWPEKEEIND